MLFRSTASPALATKNLIPAFARKYGVSCQLCHAPVPKLTPAGEKFAANGFEFEPGEEPRDTIATGDPTLRLQKALPLAVRFDAFTTAMTKTAEGQPTADMKAPWVIKLLSGGQVANKVSYYTYFLLTEAGDVAGLEDAYLQFTDVGKSGVNVIVGQFQVSDPLFKRELRLMYDDYMPYKVKVGNATPDLTYDRGITAFGSPWEGGNVTVSVLTGRGLSAAGEGGNYDTDRDKNFAFRVTQEFGTLRVGGFAYTGSEKANEYRNTTTVFGPDATLTMGKLELNAQYLQRKDDNPYFGACSIATPCPGGNTRVFGTTVKSGFAEAIYAPQGAAGKLFLTGLYNWADADAPVMHLGVGEEAPLSKYRTASGGVHWLYHRNMRFTGEMMWDFEREIGRVLVGLVVGF